MDLGNVALLQDWASDPFFFVGGGGYNVPRHHGWSPNRGSDIGFIGLSLLQSELRTTLTKT